MLKFLSDISLLENILITLVLYFFLIFRNFSWGVISLKKKRNDLRNYRKKVFNDHIISLKGEIWAHKTSLTQPLSTEVPVLSQENEQSCICVLMVSISSLSTIFLLDFGTVPTVWFLFVFFFILLVKMSSKSRSSYKFFHRKEHIFFSKYLFFIW